MRRWRVSRYADDPAIPAPDATDDSVADLPLDENSEELVFFPVSRDSQRIRRRNYKLTSAGDLACTLDRPATKEEIEKVREIREKLKAEGHTGLHGVGEVDESKLKRSRVHIHGPVGGAIVHVMDAAEGELSTALEKAKTMRLGVPYGSSNWQMWNSAVYILGQLLERGEDVDFEREVK